MRFTECTKRRWSYNNYNIIRYKVAQYYYFNSFLNLWMILNIGIVTKCVIYI